MTYVKYLNGWSQRTTLNSVYSIPESRYDAFMFHIDGNIMAELYLKLHKSQVEMVH